MRFLLFLCVALLAVACKSPDVVCTAVGCVNGLIVEVQNAPAGPITVQATDGSAGDSVHTITCPGESGCTNTVFFLGSTPASAQLTITTTSGTRRQVVRATYTTSQRNGPRCPDICRSGVGRITWR
jgi:hypothetical protein